MWAWWHSPEILDRLQFYLSIGAGSFAFVAAVLTLSGVLARNQAASLRAAQQSAEKVEASRREAKLLEDLRQTQQRLQDVQARQKPRTLTAEQQHRLWVHLSAAPKGHAILGVIGGDPEAEAFGQSVMDVLLDLGWSIDFIEHFAPSQLFGFIMSVRSTAAFPPHGMALIQGLSQFGLMPSFSIDPSIPESSLKIFVGHKPPLP
jgi:hypothetical protein